MAHELPNPTRYTDDDHGLLPKVFIVYPHNPQVYTWVAPTPIEDLQRKFPGKSDLDLRKIQVEDARKRENEREEIIRRHDELVFRFAQFLGHFKIAVAYEGLLLDHATPNKMKWFEEQMKGSDYILLIITDSFNHFLFHQPPEEKEPIFVGDFLHIVVYNSKKRLLPIFLDRPKNLDLLPSSLRSSSTYHVVMTSDRHPYFDVRQPELDSLYSFLTNQDRIQPPPAPKGGVPIMDGLRRKRGNVAGVRNYDDRHRRMYDSLLRLKRPLTSGEVANLAEKRGFAIHWKMLAESLHFTTAEIERIANDHEDAEQCFQVLSKWMQREHGNATVSVLIEGVYTHCRSAVMLEIAHSVLH